MKPRRRYSTAQLLVVVILCGAALLQIGCGGGGAVGTDGAAGRGSGGSGGVGAQGAGGASATVTHELDILFLIDNSSSMQLSQDSLRMNFPKFIAALRGLPGGLPDIHIAVVTSDMGAGMGIADCDNSQGGLFQYQPGPAAWNTCTATTLVPGATFISAADDEATKNYTDPIENVFSCIAAVGDKGCGFENQFAAVARALGADGASPPAQNAGFLRPNAALAIVMVTNEDDCSATGGAKSPLYNTDASGNSLQSMWGPPSSYRCNEFGHLCGNAPAKPPRLAPSGNVGDVVSLTNCTSAEDGVLIRVRDFVGEIKKVKSDPDKRLLVAAISGPTTTAAGATIDPPYQVQWINPQTMDTGPWPEITHSCTASDGDFADPAVRITQMLGQLTNGAFYSLCQSDLGPALADIAQRLARMMGLAP